jgi:hypothetical protein
MRIKLTHPLWTHIPAAAVLVVFIVYIVTAGGLPAEAPVHFNTVGVADTYGSPLLVFIFTVCLSAGYIVLSVFLDELWARQENAKTFNWLSLLDEIVVGPMVGIGLGYLAFLTSGSTIFHLPWWQMTLTGGIAVILAVIAEMLRPFHARPERIIARDAVVEGNELVQKLRENMQFVYWDAQNPLYITLLSTIIPLIMFIVAFVSVYEQPWVCIIMLIAGILLILPYGGQRTMVNRKEIIIRFGILGFKILRLNVSEIAAAELHDFSPLKDFGGYGIRFNGEMKAYFQRGTRGVKLTTVGDKKYLIGSDRPEFLSAVIKASADMNKSR